MIEWVSYLRIFTQRNTSHHWCNLNKKKKKQEFTGFIIYIYYNYLRMTRDASLYGVVCLHFFYIWSSNYNFVCFQARIWHEAKESSCIQRRVKTPPIYNCQFYSSNKTQIITTFYNFFCRVSSLRSTRARQLELGRPTTRCDVFEKNPNYIIFIAA